MRGDRGSWAQAPGRSVWDLAAPPLVWVTHSFLPAEAHWHWAPSQRPAVVSQLKITTGTFPLEFSGCHHPRPQHCPAAWDQTLSTSTRLPPDRPRSSRQPTQEPEGPGFPAPCSFRRAQALGQDDSSVPRGPRVATEQHGVPAMQATHLNPHTQMTFLLPCWGLATTSDPPHEFKSKKD